MPLLPTSSLHPVPRWQRRARRLATPWSFYVMAGRLVRWLAAVAVIGGAAALLAGHAAEQPGLALLHAVSASLAGGLYLLMALAGALGLAGVARLCPIVAAAAAPSTAVMALVALACQLARAAAGDGGGWGASLVATEAVLLPFIVGVMLLQHGVPDPVRADRAAALLAAAGLLPLALLHLAETPTSPLAGHWPPSAALVLGLLAGAAYATAAVLQRTRLEIVERARRQLQALEAL